MKKIASIVILFVMAITLTIAYAIIQAQQAPEWQVKLDNYVKYRNDILAKDPVRPGTLTIVAVTAAKYPENFHQSGDKQLVSGGHYWLLEHKDALSSAPEKVVCALLEERIQADGGTESEMAYQFLFLAYFSQPVEPDWLIYRGDNTAAVGCDLAYPQ